MNADAASATSPDQPASLANGTSAPNEAERQLNVGSLFSGIGGIDLGLERAGMRVVFQAEADSWRRVVLRRHWPDTPCFEDVDQVDETAWATRFGARRRALGGESGDASPDASRPGLGRSGACDLLCGGFPCQDLSVAGRRAGLAGARSSLFFEFARVAESLRPRWLLVENVPGLLSSNGGRDFALVLATLAELGYGVCWRVLDSRFFGVPQRRRRVFVVGHLGATSAEPFLPFLEGGEGHPQTRGEAGPAASVASLSGLGSGGPDDNDGQGGRLIPALTTRAGNTQDDQQTGQLVTHSLTAEGHDASEDGTGRGTPIIAAPLSHGSNPNSNAAGRRREDDENLVTGPLGGGNDGIGRRRTQDDRNLVQVGPLTGGNTPHGPRGGPQRLDPHSVSAGQYSVESSAVRRLTPTECCRLQGFPDDWLGEPNEPPDSPRYAALGDAVTVNVARWIGERIMEAEAA